MLWIGLILTFDYVFIYEMFPWSNIHLHELVYFIYFVATRYLWCHIPYMNCLKEGNHHQHFYPWLFCDNKFPLHFIEIFKLFFEKEIKFSNNIKHFFLFDDGLLLLSLCIYNWTFLSFQIIKNRLKLYTNE